MARRWRGAKSAAIRQTSISARRQARIKNRPRYAAIRHAIAGHPLSQTEDSQSNPWRFADKAE
jgi:hypothetical protein